MIVQNGSTEHPSEWILEAARNKGWSQRDLAKQLQMDESNFSKYMTGVQRIFPPLAKKIEALLGVDSEDILYQQYVYLRARNKKIA